MALLNGLGTYPLAKYYYISIRYIVEAFYVFNLGTYFFGCRRWILGSIETWVLLAIDAERGSDR